MGHTALCLFCTISSAACEAACVSGCGPVTLCGPVGLLGSPRQDWTPSRPIVL